MSLSEFFYDGRKLFMSLILTLLFIVVFFMYKQEVIPYSVYLLLFSRYFGELNPTAFLIFYYFLVSYIFSSMIIVLYDLVVIIAKNRMKK
ncbi:hypothetical protein A3K64_00995 [Candidatus Micrarchaeota archaeon RBG_16_36_9]|nr:MAG: hypothetical protein A3K64_00995 [Candidatus Micrarchaeota archaeon RBG_16_36_9]